MEKTFIENEQSKVEITNVFEKTDEASSLFTNISDEVVKAYTSDLDKLLVKIVHIKKDLIKQEMKVN